LHKYRLSEAIKADFQMSVYQMIVVLAAHHLASLRRTGRFAKQSDTAWASLFVFISIKDFNKAMHNQFVDAMKGHAAGSGQSKGGRTVRASVTPPKLASTTSFTRAAYSIA